MTDTTKMTPKTDTDRERDADGRFVSDDAASTSKSSADKSSGAKPSGAKPSGAKAFNGAGSAKASKPADKGHSASKPAGASPSGTSAKAKDDSHSAPNRSADKTRGS